MRHPKDTVDYYPWGITRWLSSATRARLSAAGRGIFRDLLDFCYAQGVIPSDPDTLCGMVNCTRAELDAAWVVIGKHFVQRRNDKLYLQNTQVNAFRRALFASFARSRKAGKRGGRPSRVLFGAGQVHSNQQDENPLVSPQKTPLLNKIKERENNRGVFKNETKTNENENPPVIENGTLCDPELFQAAAARMRARHKRKDGLGGNLLEQTLSDIIGKAADPNAVLCAIEARHKVACEREWSDRETRFWPRLGAWLRESRYLDPEPEPDSAAKPDLWEETLRRLQ